MSGKDMKRVLVTGAPGQIGSELTIELRKEYGGDNVIAAGHRSLARKCLSRGHLSMLMSLIGSVEKVIEKYDIDTIYHLAAVLSAVSEENPRLAWNVNMDGLYNVLEIARKHGLIRVFWPSSIAVLIPRTMYGITKVAGELSWGEF